VKQANAFLIAEIQRLRRMVAFAQARGDVPEEPAAETKRPRRAKRDELPEGVMYTEVAGGDVQDEVLAGSPRKWHQFTTVEAAVVFREGARV
jgi:hypothetical protein